MRSYIYVYKPNNRSSDPNKDMLHIYRLINNTPHHLATVGRGYRSEHQAVVETLVGLGELPKKYKNDVQNAWMLKRDRVANINSIGGL